jgi:hypothetical protein
MTAVERVARRMAEVDADVNRVWQEYLPLAQAAIDEMNAIKAEESHG